MPDMQDTPPRADVDEILRRKRKAREYKVCSHARSVMLETGECKRWERENLKILPCWAMESGVSRDTAEKQLRPTMESD